MNAPTYLDLPEEVRRALAEGIGTVLGSPRPVEGGFSPGLTCLVDTTRGSYFVKAVHESQSSVSVSLVRDELEVLELMPSVGPPVPALRLEVEASGWMVLVTDAVAGRSPGSALDEAGLRAVLDALARLGARVRADPALPSLLERYEDLLDHAPALLAARPEFARGLSTAEASRRVTEAVASAAAGDDFVHADLRGDNVILDRHGEAWLVDWAWGCRGRSWADAVTTACAAPQVAASTRWSVLTGHPATAAATPEELWGFTMAITAMYSWCADRPAPPGVEGLRPWQAHQARSAEQMLVVATAALEAL